MPEQLFEGEKYAPVKSYTAKELMILYEERSYNTWKRLLLPIAHKLPMHCVKKGEKKGRYKYYKREVEFIFNFLGRPLL